MQTRSAVVAVLAAAVLFGTAGAAQELGPETTTPLSLGTVRGLVGAGVLWLVVRVERRRLAGLSLRPHLAPIAVGGLGVALYQPAFLAGVDRAGVAVGTIVAISSAPFAAGALDWLVLGRRPSRAWLVATLVTVTGGIVLVAGQRGGDEVDLSGLPFALAAGSGYALYSVTSKSTIERGLDPTAALAAPFTVGSSLLLAVTVTHQSFGWLATGAGLALGMYLGVVATGLAYVLYGRGLRSIPSSTAVTLVLAEPVTAAVLAVVVLDERLGATGWAGAAIVLLGLALAGRSVTSSPDRPTVRFR